MLRKIHNYASKPYLILPLCITLLFASCTKNEVNSDTGTSISELSQKTYTGEQLFRGIFFAEGTVAAAINELKDLNIRNFLEGEELNRALYFQDELIKRIAAEDPVFFNTFRLAMQSRDHLRIQTELKRAGEVVKIIFSDMISRYTTPEAENQVDAYKSQLTEKLGKEGVKSGAQVSRAIKEVLQTAKDSGRDNGDK